MKIQPTSSLIFCLLFTLNAFSQQSIEGIWKGESICQVKNSPCHDETVVYHISKDSLPNSFVVIGNKIVDGKEEYMGTIKFKYDPAKSTLISTDGGSNGRWEFQVQGLKMSGKLISKNQLYRLINLEKKN